jgi:hypothetical protein
MRRPRGINLIYTIDKLFNTIERYTQVAFINPRRVIMPRDNVNIVLTFCIRANNTVGACAQELVCACLGTDQAILLEPKNNGIGLELADYI